MMGIIIEVLATIGFLAGMSIIGAIIVIGLALVWATIETKREKKAKQNCYYRGYRRG